MLKVDCGPELCGACTRKFNSNGWRCRVFGHKLQVVESAKLIAKPKTLRCRECLKADGGEDNGRCPIVPAK
jgi:hypothetical protein